MSRRSPHLHCRARAAAAGSKASSSRRSAHTICDSDKIPSSAAFDAIAAALSDDADRKDAVKKGGAVFAFTIKNQAGETDSWYIDLKKTGTVGKGAAPEGGKADGELDTHTPRAIGWGLVGKMAGCVTAHTSSSFLPSPSRRMSGVGLVGAGRR